MSNLINKAKDALSGHNKDHTTSTSTTGTTGAYDDPRSTNAGPHGSNMGNKVDPRVDSDRDNRNDPTSSVGGYGTQGTHTGTTGVGGTGAGLHSGTGTTGVGGTGAGYGTHGTSTNAGPHNSNLMNKVDPRVDSDLDNRNDPTSRVGGYGTQGTGVGGSGSGLTSGGAGVTGTHGTHGTHGTTGTHGTSGGYGTSQSTNAGPHSSNLANKLDPRVDSDRDGRNDPSSRTGGYGQTQDTYGSGVTGGTTTGAGGYGTTTGHGTTGAHHATTGTGGGIGGNSGSQYNDPRSTNVGPHSSNMANKLDPRVDSDVDNRNNPASSTGGYGQTQQTHGTGMTGGTTGAHGTHGTHGAGTTGGYGTGSGPTKSGETTASGMPSTQNAAHSSNLMNRLDPRVKADKEGNPLH